MIGLQDPLIPDEHRDAIIAHIVKVHQSVGEYSKVFLQKLRRANFVTPKNYLDFINVYTNLLKEKDNYVQNQVWRERAWLTL